MQQAWMGYNHDSSTPHREEHLSFCILWPVVGRPDTILAGLVGDEDGQA